MLSIIRNICAQVAIFWTLNYSVTGYASAPQQVSLTINGHKIVASVARTNAQREKGLMNQQKLGKNEGMLFVFPRVEYHSMWMKNTPIPLDVAFINQNGSIINIANMAAMSLTTHTAQQPAKYTLEMNAGWFHHHGAKAGDIVQGLSHAGEGL